VAERRVDRDRDQRFRAEQHVRRRAEFRRIYDRGERVRARLMTVMVLPNGGHSSRLGIAATKKLGGAVVRNRAKRVVREIFRRARVPGGLDIVVIPRAEMLDAAYPVIEAEFGYVLRRAGRPGLAGQARAASGQHRRAGER
jgi:ribonuclease P protein component